MTLYPTLHWRAISTFLSYVFTCMYFVDNKWAHTHLQSPSYDVITLHSRTQGRFMLVFDKQYQMRIDRWLIFNYRVISFKIGLHQSINDLYQRKRSKQTHFATVLFPMQHWDSERLLNQKPPAGGASNCSAIMIVRASSVLCLCASFSCDDIISVLFAKLISAVLLVCLTHCPCVSPTHENWPSQTLTFFICEPRSGLVIV